MQYFAMCFSLEDQESANGSTRFHLAARLQWPTVYLSRISGNIIP
jgi:hypothetical protein